MGFFKDDAEAVSKRPRAQPGKARERKVSVLDPNAVGCDACPLKTTWSHIATPQMAMTGGGESTDILILGEFPSEEEDALGLVLPQKSKWGQMIRDAIPRRYHSRLAFQNILRCKPDDGALNARVATHACSPHMNADFDYLPNLKAIVGFGDVPLRHFFKVAGTSITNIHGNRFPVQLYDGRIVWYYPVIHPEYVIDKGKSAKFGTGYVAPVFKADLHNFFARIDRATPPRIISFHANEVLIPRSYNEAMEMISRMKGLLGVDIESSRLRPYEIGALILCAAISDGNTTIAFPCEHPDGPTDWGLDVLYNVMTNYQWVAHNAAMEYGWARWYWPEAPIQLPEDSMACARLYHQRETILSLAMASRFHLGIDIKSLSNVDASHIMDYPLAEILPYCGIDAKACLLIHAKLRPTVNDTNYERILRTVVSTSEMELRGLPADLEAGARLRVAWQERSKHLLEEVGKQFEVRQWEADHGTTFNVGSAEHVGEALVRYGKLKLPRTPKDKQWSTDEKALAPYIDTNPLVKLVLDYRTATNMDSTFISPIMEIPSRFVDGMLHPTYTTMLVATQRLSSRKPNIQNYPSRNALERELRTMIAAPRGYILLKFDFGQLEVRVIAMASRDRFLCENLIKKMDMHAYWRDFILKLYPEYWQRLMDKTGETDETKILKGARDIMKSDFVFASFFGASAQTCSRQTGVPLLHMQAAAAELWRQYPGVQKWIKAKRREYDETGRSFSLTGRGRHSLMSGNEPINNPIQSTAADIVIDCMNDLSEMSRAQNDPFLHPRINIHDDLTFILPDSAEVPNYIETIQSTLVKRRYSFQNVPLVVEGAVGLNWAKLDGFATFTGDYYR